ncbi:MAG: hypothetical protein KGJ86_11470 [Chloroflexota bacterium]|nr:hypothetical protein [Chloroflexota bacterium]
MTDATSFALSDFIDSLPLEAEEARRLFAEVAPLSGSQELAELAQLALVIRGVPRPEPRASWLSATKQLLLAAFDSKARDGAAGVIWLGSLFVPPDNPGRPGLGWLSWARLAAAAVLTVAIVTTALGHPLSLVISSPLMQVVDQAF